MTQTDLDWSGGCSHCGGFDCGGMAPPRARSRPELAIWEHVRDLMADGSWWNLPDLERAVTERRGKAVTGSALSAAVRTLRWPARGGHDVERKRVGPGQTYLYRVVR